MGGKRQAVYVLLSFGDTETPNLVEVYGARWEAEKRAESLARVKGFRSTRDLFYHLQTGELHMNRGGQLTGTNIFVLEKEPIRSPKHMVTVKAEDRK